MTEWIEQDKKDENHLYVHLKDPSLLDWLNRYIGD